MEREERVAFIGISNWALDPAKMNRGIMVTRCDPTREELELSAKCVLLVFCLTVYLSDSIHIILYPFPISFLPHYQIIAILQTNLYQSWER